MDWEKALEIRYKAIAVLLKQRDYKGIIRFCRNEMRHDQRRWARRELLGYACIAATHLQDYPMVERLLWKIIHMDTMYHQCEDVYIYLELGELLLKRQRRRQALDLLHQGLKLAMKERDWELHVLFLIYKNGLDAISKPNRSRYHKAFNQVLEDWDISLPDNMTTVNQESIAYAKKEVSTLYCAYQQIYSEVILLRKENKDKEADAVIRSFVQKHPTPHIKRLAAAIPNSLE